ncbi:hypothetical protein SEA_ATUIN_315 [Arthrobacter phage Atuin]|nr:hypothetical protein SEA_ATUIN_114 [Arthrobacter phage Atuin]
MRLHSNTLTDSDIRDSIQAAKDAGKIDRLVGFEIFDDKGSRTRAKAWEIQLGWYGDKVRGDGRRWKNTGKSGADSYGNGGGCYAATYDEWGWFIAELYKRDANLVFGHYKTRELFNDYTKNAYRD